MIAKRMVSTLNGVLMALSAGMLHAAESTPAGASKLTECPMPVLPISAVKQEMFGDVTLWYQGNAQGRVADTRIVKTSGFRELDKAAIISLSRCRLPIPSEGEALPSGTTEYKFGRPTRIDNASGV
ncbi:MAG: uncharacterized protein JWP34_1253 [Massilia sp.]|jgi:TonB family protein|nr:uncharacterized protein [Massilia sp.]